MRRRPKPSLGGCGSACRPCGSGSSGCLPRTSSHIPIARRARGRPRRLWSLAPGAASLFPDTHAQLTVDLIGSIRNELGETALARLLERRREQITASYRKRLAREPDIARKLTALADMRSAEGYMARLETLADEGFLLVEDHCPICAAAMTCQGFCSIELQVFRNLLGPGWHIEREDHLLTGARRCSYRITPAAAVST